MKNSIIAILMLLVSATNYAQTKVFKEVNEEIKSQIKAIRQDGSLVGYMVFTQLEKVTADSFHYKITIMDENLNDIGAINFREQKLNLQAVSFEQDVLCIAYLKSNMIGNEFKNRRDYIKKINDAKNAIMTQFLSLDGKIIKSNTISVEIDLPKAPVAIGSKLIGDGELKHGIQLKNVPRKGFACFYGDEHKNNLLIFSPQGKQIWQKTIKERADAFVLLCSGFDVLILAKSNEEWREGGYELLGFRTSDSTTFAKYALKDKKGNSLKVLAFDNDPVTGKPYLSGNIIDANHGHGFRTPKEVARGTYSGVFTINVKGPKKGDIEEVFSYWSDGSQTSISKRGLYTDNGMYGRHVQSFRDYQGNTYFAGPSFVKKTRWGAIAASVVTAPLIFPPLYLIGTTGTQKSKTKDAILIKQTMKGGLSFENTIPANETKYYPAKVPFYMYDSKSFYHVINPDTKTNYVIVDDVDDIVIYNVNQKKVVRTIPHRERNTETYIYPAKEGHIMVSEYNKKEKSTRFSIESL